ncbi:hypothetical protein GW17_00062129 [Ensete ventricosum]|nr:hypothetical protein GW17_00062129 [Ensete ventricosum]
MGSHTKTVSPKVAKVIIFARSHAQSRVSIDCTISKIQNSGHSQRNSPWEVVRARFRKKTRRSYTLREVACRVEFRSVVRVPSQKFKILAIPDVLAHGKSYKHSFMKKYSGHKLCVKSRVESSFDRFFVHHQKNSKYWPYPTN